MITLKNLHEATQQEIFNQVGRHLLTQNARSTGIPPKTVARWDSQIAQSCLYRSGDLKCAAGCLIADDEYKPEFEGNGFLRVYNLYKEITGSFELCKNNPDKAFMLVSLQNLHDAGSAEDWRSGLEDLAEEYKLNFQEMLAGLDLPHND